MTRKIKRKIEPYMYLIPALIFFIVVNIYPIAEVIRLSFFRSSLIGGITRYVGLENYVYLFSPEFARILYRTGIWIAGSVSLGLILGLVGGLLFSKDFTGKNYLRMVAFTPWIIPSTMIAVLGGWMIHPWYGLVNNVLIKMHLISQPIGFLSFDRALFTVIVVRGWRLSPFGMITILGALESIPKQLYEAAEIDGTSKMQAFRYITLPLIKPVLITTATLMTIWSMIIFDLIYVLTGGGPAGATEIISVAIYNKAFGGQNVGRATSMSVLAMAILACVVYMYYRLILGKGGEE